MGGWIGVWYILAGFLLGWVLSTLTEWLWFRQRRTQGKPSLSPPTAPAAATPSAMPAPEAYTPAYATAPATVPATVPTPVAETPPAPADVVPTPYPDPLSQIRGIGVVYEKRLYNAGIFTWHQLANTDPHILRVTTRAQSNTDPQSWIDQARQLAQEQGRIGAIYTGPRPDDLTRIDGIGNHYERDLYQAGIYTYEQVAALSPTELAQILPEVGVSGEDVDYSHWIEQAAQLQQSA